MSVFSGVELADDWQIAPKTPVLTLGSQTSLNYDNYLDTEHGAIQVGSTQYPNIPDIASFNNAISVNDEMSVEDIYLAYISAQAGDCVVFEDGTYDWQASSATTRWNNPNGTQEDPIYMIARNKHQAIITGASDARVDTSYQIFVGFAHVDMTVRVYEMRAGWTRFTSLLFQNQSIGNCIHIPGGSGVDWGFCTIDNCEWDAQGNDPLQSTGITINNSDDYTQRFIHLHNCHWHDAIYSTTRHLIWAMGTDQKGPDDDPVGPFNGNMFFRIENNLYENWDNDEEDFSVKGGTGVIRNNLQICSGNALNGIILRQTNNLQYTGNWSVNIRRDIRLVGPDSLIAFNYNHKAGPDDSNPSAISTHNRQIRLSDNQIHYNWANNSEFRHNVFSGQGVLNRLVNNDPEPSTDTAGTGTVIDGNAFYSSEMPQTDAPGNGNYENLDGFVDETTWRANNTWGTNTFYLVSFPPSTEIDPDLFDGPGDDITTGILSAVYGQPSVVQKPSWWGPDTNITTQPIDVIVTEPDEAIFSIIVTYAGSIFYLWESWNPVEGEWEDVSTLLDASNETTDEVTINTTEYLEVPYPIRCRVRYDNDTAVLQEYSDEVSLIVLPLEVEEPTIDTQPNDLVVTEPLGGIFEVEASSPHPLFYRWQAAQETSFDYTTHNHETYPSVYPDHWRQRIDRYVPISGPPLTKGFLMVHGGAWVIGTKTQMRPIGQFYASRGIVVGCNDYIYSDGDGTGDQFPQFCEETREALEYMQATHPTVTEWYIGGHSAGAHIASYVFATEPSIAGLFSLDSAATYMPDLPLNYKVPWTRPTFREDQEEEASPLTHLRDAVSHTGSALMTQSDTFWTIWHEDAQQEFVAACTGANSEWFKEIGASHSDCLDLASISGSETSEKMLTIMNVIDGWQYVEDVLSAVSDETTDTLSIDSTILSDNSFIRASVRAGDSTGPETLSNEVELVVNSDTPPYEYFDDFNRSDRNLTDDPDWEGLAVVEDIFIRDEQAAAVGGNLTGHWSRLIPAENHPSNVMIEFIVTVMPDTSGLGQGRSSVGVHLRGTGGAATVDGLTLFIQKVALSNNARFRWDRYDSGSVVEDFEIDAPDGIDVGDKIGMAIWEDTAYCFLNDELIAEWPGTSLPPDTGTAGINIVQLAGNEGGRLTDFHVFEITSDPASSLEYTWKETPDRDYGEVNNYNQPSQQYPFGVGNQSPNVYHYATTGETPPNNEIWYIEGTINDEKYTPRHVDGQSLRQFTDFGTPFNGTESPSIDRFEYHIRNSLLDIGMCGGFFNGVAPPGNNDSDGGVYGMREGETLWFGWSEKYMHLDTDSDGSRTIMQFRTQQSGTTILNQWDMNRPPYNDGNMQTGGPGLGMTLINVAGNSYVRAATRSGNGVTWDNAIVQTDTEPVEIGVWKDWIIQYTWSATTNGFFKAWKFDPLVDDHSDYQPDEEHLIFNMENTHTDYDEYGTVYLPEPTDQVESIACLQLRWGLYRHNAKDQDLPIIDGRLEEKILGPVKIKHQEVANISGFHAVKPSGALP